MIKSYDDALVVLKNLMSNLPGNVYWKGWNGSYLGCNDRQAKLLGFESGDEIVGKTDFDLPWPKDHIQEYRANDLRIMQQGKAEVIEEIFGEEGDTVLSIKAPLKDERGDVFGVLGISIDITETKRMEQLKKEKEIAEKNAELMSILSGSVAHEVRTPLSIIKINADLLQLLDAGELFKSKEQSQNFSTQIKSICQAVRECSQVIDMLLVKLRKISVGAIEEGANVQLESCSIEKTIQQALAQYPFREDEKVCYQGGPEFFYQGDERLIKHVLFNLIRNALRAIKTAGKGEIFIQCCLDKNFNCIVFRDTASGIEPEYLPKIFNKFETTDDAHSGTGLGLAFCKLVMESYGGKIECHSEFGQFTEFTLLFPSVPLLKDGTFLNVI